MYALYLKEVRSFLSSIVGYVFIVIFSFTLMFTYYWKLALVILLVIPFYKPSYKVSNTDEKELVQALKDTIPNFSEDLKTGNLNRSNILLSYKGPAPPSGSGEHIYNFELYKQNSNLDKIVMDEDDRIISLNDIKSKIGIQGLKPVSSVFFYSKYTNTFGGSNIKRNIKRKTIKKTRKSKKSKKVRYIKR